MDLKSLVDDQRFSLHWQMSQVERLTLIAILERIRPALSLEVGTYEGGSLQVLSAYSKRVISVDINPEVMQSLGGRFDNVEFRTGPSVQLLPHLVESLNRSGDTPQFVLIDGDHSTDGIRRDIESILLLKPVREVIVLLHDSFNPACRAGMTAANWAASPYVHSVEIDFTPGVFFGQALSTVPAGSMWGGFACALMKPEIRRQDVEITESEKEVFETMLREASIYTAEKRRSPGGLQGRVHDFFRKRGRASRPLG